MNRVDRASIADRLKGLLGAPEEGWGTLVALLVMMAVAAFAIDESAWAREIAGTQIRQTAFLPIASVLAGLTGYFLARSRLSTLLSWTVTFLGRGRAQMASTEQWVFARNAMEQLERHEREKETAEESSPGEERKAAG